jgi:hypothetical protein
LNELLDRINLLIAQVNSVHPIEVKVNCGEPDRLIFLNGLWNAQGSLFGLPAVSVSVEVIGSCPGAQIIADAVGLDDPLVIDDADDLAEDGRITPVGFSVKSGGSVFLHCPGTGEDGQCTARMWIHGPRT